MIDLGLQGKPSIKRVYSTVLYISTVRLLRT